MQRSEAQKILEQVKTNLAKLRGCKGPHEFEPYTYYNDNPEGLVRDFKCKLCGGTTSTFNVSWYQDGVKHGWLQAVACLRELDSIAESSFDKVVKSMDAYCPKVRP